MTKKILLAGLLGGIAMFLWEGLAHEVLPLGEAGIRGLDNEAAIVATIKANVTQSGMYMFPGGEVLRPGLSGAEKQAAEKKAMELWRAGPSGIIVVHPGGLNPESPGQLLTQCVLDVAVTLLAAFLISLGTAGAPYITRVVFVTLIGLAPTLNAELPYWNWYGFPAVYVAAQATIHLAGFLVAGLIVARFVRTPAPKPLRSA
jgi:hypothetical protein